MFLNISWIDDGIICKIKTGLIKKVKAKKLKGCAHFLMPMLTQILTQPTVTTLNLNLTGYQGVQADLDIKFYFVHKQNLSAENLCFAEIEAGLMTVVYTDIYGLTTY